MRLWMESTLLLSLCVCTSVPVKSEQSTKAQAKPPNALDVDTSVPTEAQDDAEMKTQIPAETQAQESEAHAQSQDDNEPHLFELLDAPLLGPELPGIPGQPGLPGQPVRRGWRGRAGARRIDYYYHYPRDMPLRRTKQQSFELMQQVMYSAKTRMRELSEAVAPYATRMAYRMAILHGYLAQLILDLRAIWSMAVNNELLISYPMRRLIALYSHELRKYFDVTYIVEYMLLLHHRNVRTAYGMQREVDSANAEIVNMTISGGTATTPPGPPTVVPDATTEAVPDAPTEAVPDAPTEAVPDAPPAGRKLRHRHRPLIARVKRRKVTGGNRGLRPGGGRRTQRRG